MLTSASFASAAGCPMVETVMRRAPMPKPSGEFMIAIASSTWRRLCVGSPEPMKT